MSAPGTPPSPLPAGSLAEARLPPRVRAVLEALMRVASDQFERRLEATLQAFEQQLFRLADHARNPAAESGYMRTLRDMRLARADLVPRFMLGLETALAALERTPGVDADAAPPPATGKLALVATDDVDADLVLDEIVQRGESRAGLPLHLLGQRFGVLAAAPAFDSARLPLGPRVVCGVLRDASAALQLPPDAQQLLLRTFERKVMDDYGELAELFNATLADEGILPALTHVPLRVRPSPAPDAAPARREAAPGAAAGPARDGVQAERDPERAHAAWHGDPAAAAADAEVEAAFETLQDLLARRRADGGPAGGGARRGAPASATAGGGVAATSQVLHLLEQLRTALAVSGTQAASISELRGALVDRMRAAHGPDATLSRQDSDAFDLLDMFYERIGRDVRTESLAAELLRRLQLPILRTALTDRGFFSRPQHPARRLLNTVAESGARWLDQDGADPALLAPIERAVEHVVQRAHEDPQAFEAGNHVLDQALQAQARRSEVAERRHVEAARGREKLEIARRLAADEIARAIGARSPPGFVHALLEQAWADALTLSALRHGSDSDQWRQMQQATERIVAASCDGAIPADGKLAGEVQAALAQVGYHADEAGAIARRLTHPGEGDDDAPRTQLAASLKSRARLGGDPAQPRAAEAPPPRTPDEEAQYQRVRTLPFGTWIEFVTNQQGDVLRKRLSWYSLVTDNALFVNLRGQRAGEQSLDALARLLARGQARVVTPERARLVDRAWQATLATLRSLAGRDARNEGEATP